MFWVITNIKGKFNFQIYRGILEYNKTNPKGGNKRQKKEQRSDGKI